MKEAQLSTVGLFFKSSLLSLCPYKNHQNKNLKTFTFFEFYFKTLPQMLCLPIFCSSSFKILKK